MWKRRLISLDGCPGCWAHMSCCRFCHAAAHLTIAFPGMVLTPRECYIKKCVDFKGFGFTLHAEVEKGKYKEFINKID